MNNELWLQEATKKLIDAGIQTARLDALVLLEFATAQERSFILAHPEAILLPEQEASLELALSRRIKREPIAYIVGKKEFYGRDFTVTKDVLIPRPESESFIEALQNNTPLSGKSLLDVGTGSGALAITIALEHPELQVFASDVSNEALKIAKLNATNLQATVTLLQADLLEGVEQDFDIIVANLPYVPEDFKSQPELSYEPHLALYAQDGGLSLINQLFEQAPAKLLEGGLLLIESLPSQHAAIKDTARVNGFTLLSEHDLIIAFTLS
jgi:release factor glutamine methyltransferase